jgi:hypothetical protein
MATYSGIRARAKAIAEKPTTTADVKELAELIAKLAKACEETDMKAVNAVRTK